MPAPLSTSVRLVAIVARMIATRFTERFQLDHPIVCAPMALITGGELAGAVSKAGGLGIIGGGYAGTLGAEPSLEDQWRLAGNQRVGIGFINWAASKDPSVIDAALAHNPACLFLSFGEGTAFARQAVDAGVPVIWQVQTMAQIPLAIEAGADVIVTQGGEAGGHGGERGTLSFTAEAADWLAKHAPDTLLLAAGGIADGRGLAAALMLGADGVLVGSRFWASKEALTPEAMVDKAIAATGDDTVRTKVVDKLRGVDWPDEWSFRVMKNDMTESWVGKESEAVFGGMKPAYDAARANNDLDIVATIVGEAAGLIRSRPPAAEIVTEMAGEAEQLLKSADRFVRISS